MANKAISELPQALNVNNQDLFVLEQSGIAKKLTAETFITEQGIIDALAEALDGHGGIQSVTLQSLSGRVRTYRITFTDQSATTFQVLDGTTIERIAKTSEAGLVSTYTIFMSDGTTSFFNVRNGADGDVSEATLNSELAKKAPVITETVSSTAIAAFADGADDMPIQSVLVDIEPVQDLSNGDPSPTNICPITGHTEVNVTRTGKNLLNLDRTLGTPNPADGSNATSPRVMDTSHYYVGLEQNNYYYPSNVNSYSVTSSSVFAKGNNNAYGVGFPIEVKGNTTYTVSGTATANPYLGITYYDSSWNYLSGASKVGSSLTFTTPSSAAYAVILLRSTDTSAGATWTNVQLELGSTATTYEPYIAPTTASLSWQTEAGIVYGGTVDLVSGNLTIDKALYTFVGDESFTIVQNTQIETFNYFRWYSSSFVSIFPNWNIENDAILSCYPVTNQVLYWYAGGVNNDNIAWTVKGFPGLCIRDDSITTEQELKAFLAGKTMCYKLATPQTYQLSGQQLMTLLGTNNVWTDIANVTVKYPADTKMYIDNAIAALA